MTSYHNHRLPSLQFPFPSFSVPRLSPQGAFDVVQKVFSAKDRQGMTIDDKVRLFFYDYSLGPLFVQENYIRASAHAARLVMSHTGLLGAICVGTCLILDFSVSLI